MRDEVEPMPRDPSWVPPAPLVTIPRMTLENLRWAAQESEQAREWEEHGVRMLANRGSWWTCADIASRSKKIADECWAFSVMYLLHALTGEP